ncbi:MAG: Asp-tRNA(Asn)/Glu-tRNA(Gln) amidotransferase subunit GatB [Gammaproteobacteria bacterium]|nr:Asp-tRNA(Asn)/Glu-tRNA(Gln) amidotransferase subunit GatB [Gammaproteobacteria bacterium]NNC68047.1 Asp-tRNA(Asn)/Glu-tRNA(Gln) amidotransferase subunit GatB [Gammaproteobacteria bacterium]
MQWETVIGLEIHVQLATNSKIFSGASTAYGAEPNTQACAVDLGLPGVLPVLNKEAVRMAVMFGLAVDAKVAERSVFARKNYFYPDSPKGYQISQFELPIVEHGTLEIVLGDGERKTIGITRAHLEEDAGKSLHEEFSDSTGIDLNRCGTPLIEIVSEPDMRSAEEAVAYMKKIHSIVRYLGISDGNMQEGSFRCDANVSMRPKGQEEFGTRTETKNLNSFRFVERAIHYEIDRQIDVLENGREIVQETRLYDANKDETRSMRSKEEANDYRYFPDPDLLPVVIEPSFIEELRKQLPELPTEKITRFKQEYDLSDYDAENLVMNKETAKYFEEVVKNSNAKAKLAANWVLGDLSAVLNQDDIEINNCPVSAGMLAGLLDRIEDNTISSKIAKEIFQAMWSGEGDVDAIIEAKGLKQITDSSEIEALVEQVINDNPGQLEQYKSGKDKVFGFFVGQVMKLSKGKANPQQVNDLLKDKMK